VHFEETFFRILKMRTEVAWG